MRLEFLRGTTSAAEVGQAVVNGGYSHARKTEWAKKPVGQGPNTKSAENQFLKGNNCRSVKFN